MKYTARVHIGLKRVQHKSWSSHAYVNEYQPEKNMSGRVLKPYGSTVGWTRVEGTEDNVGVATEAVALASAIENARTYIRATRADNMRQARKIQGLLDDNDLYIIQLAQRLESFKSEPLHLLEMRVQKQLEADKRNVGELPLYSWQVTHELFGIWTS